MNKNNLEDFFKNTFENFEAEVRPSVWKNVQAGLKATGIGAATKVLIDKIGLNAIIAISSSVAAVFATIFVMNITENKTETTDKRATEPSVTVEVQKPNVQEIKNFLSVDSARRKESPFVEEKEQQNEIATKTTKKDKKQIQSLLSDERIASISSSCVGGTVPLIINLSNIGSGTKNTWSFSDGSKPKTGDNPVKYFDKPGVYTIFLTSANADGVTAVDSIHINVLDNSSVYSSQAEFSPNGDGKNDVFKFQSKNIANMHVTIYNKNGDLVYEYKGIDGKWDGRNRNGRKAKNGTYLYMISAEGVDGKIYEQKGKVKLTR